MDDDTNYNINADLAAAKLAVALQAEKLILLTDVRGLLRDRNDESTLIPTVRVSAVPKLIKDGIIGQIDENIDHTASPFGVNGLMK